MTNMTSKQRKVVYLVAILVLLAPIIHLGMPSSGEAESGGRLAQLRVEYELGESTLGNIDPSSAAMNLVLLGLRGIATDLLWINALEEQKTKNWAQLRTTIDSIIMLQPHYMKVWQFQGWNLAYNVSAEWDAVADRYYWVKEGAKFMDKGIKQNEKIPELYWESGRIYSQKIGRADEWRQFRRYFLVDPDPKYDNGVDQAINPEGKDNYLVAKGVFHAANAREDFRVQHIMMRALFRSYPYRSQLEYADALQREGIFDTVTQLAWKQGFDEWTGLYGKEEWMSPGGWVILEAQREDVLRLATRDVQQYAEEEYGLTIEVNADGTKVEIIDDEGSPEIKKKIEEELKDRIKLKEHWVNRYQDTTNYRYWKIRAQSEAEQVTVEAHRELFQGDVLFKQGKLDEAKATLMSGMAKFQKMLIKYPALQIEDLTIEEGLNAVLLWQYIHQLQQTKPPANFALKPLWDQHENRVPSLDASFRSRLGIR
jgi:hypothetical protein